MAEYIDREALLNSKDWLALSGYDRARANAIILGYPTADVVEVVRCKDCEHKGWIQEPCHGKSIDFCRVWDTPINRPDKCFCYYGVKMDVKGEGE